MNPCEYDTVLVSSLEPSSARCWPTYLLAIQVSVFVNSPRCSFLDTFIRVFLCARTREIQMAPCNASVYQETSGYNQTSVQAGPASSSSTSNSSSFCRSDASRRAQLRVLTLNSRCHSWYTHQPSGMLRQLLSDHTVSWHVLSFSACIATHRLFVRNVTRRKALQLGHQTSRRDRQTGFAITPFNFGLN